MAKALDRKAQGIIEREESPAGRVQHEVAWRYLSAHLEGLTRLKDGPLDVLDVGCWMGEVSLRLAAAGHRVTLLEPSTCLLDTVQARAEQEMPQACAGLSFMNQRVEDLENHQAGPFDLVICHETIEYMDDPLRAFNIITRVLRPRGLLSLVFLNRFGEVARLLLAERDVAAAASAFERETFPTDLNRGTGYLYSTRELLGLMEPLGYTAEGEYGLRVFCDYLDCSDFGLKDCFSAMADLEERLGKEQAFLHMARFIHLIARKD
jgi:S-adenosylmethionine-dependent methyltransferase